MRKLLLPLALVAVLMACMPRPQDASGAKLFAENCAACHGAEAQGGVGPDLTRLAKTHGGPFPRAQVMGKIEGHTMGRSTSQMPEFRALLSGPSLPVDLGDGKPRPVPMKLAALSTYLESLQR